MLWHKNKKWVAPIGKSEQKYRAEQCYRKTVVGGWQGGKKGVHCWGELCGRRLRARARGKAAPRVSGRARNAAGASKSCTFAFTSLAACFFRKDFLSVVII